MGTRMILIIFQPKWGRKAQDWLVWTIRKTVRMCGCVWGFLNYKKMPNNAEKVFECTIKRKTEVLGIFFSTNLLVQCPMKVLSDNDIVTVSKL